MSSTNNYLLQKIHYQQRFIVKGPLPTKVYYKRSTTNNSLLLKVHYQQRSITKGPLPTRSITKGPLPTNFYYKQSISNKVHYQTEIYYWKSISNKGPSLKVHFLPINHPLQTFLGYNHKPKTHRQTTTHTPTQKL